MFSVNVLIETDEEGVTDRDVMLPAIPQVGDAIYFHREDGSELECEVHSIIYRVDLDGTARVYLTVGELDL